MDNNNQIDEAMDIPVEYHEPKPAGRYQMTIREVAAIQTKYGPRFRCVGDIDGENGFTVWVPVPTKFSYRTALAQLLRANDSRIPKKLNVDKACQLLEGLLVAVDVTHGADGATYCKRVQD